ncbi:hypothetical protein nbrc107696_16560 [Gordonia spumicola]|uniref:Type IV toxin-antitoxin system AbiEi family antitoxin domain-containing protein n=1 Tax=Gordonia spumicola TaxID=589161 RepID=A0A7I9V7Z8_9ACTN|nr:hypothetical protein nbrc107696_16560 [Gordonia spumicola]
MFVTIGGTCRWGYPQTWATGRFGVFAGHAVLMGESDVAAQRVESMLREQSGVISRKQALECGVDSAFVRKKVYRREWVRVYPGVYVAHTGSLTWEQRAWCAVLDAAPAVLGFQSAVRATLGSGAETGPIHIVVDSKRSVTKRPGVVVHYRVGLDGIAMWNTSPPRTRVEHAVLDCAASCRRVVDLVACLADPVQSRITTAERLIAALSNRPCLRQASFIMRVLLDVHSGVCSTLEHRFLTHVERAHGLPSPRRQVPTAVGRSGFRDHEYLEFGLIVELDGRLGHDDPLSRDADMERDLDAAVGEDKRTVRVGFGQAFDRPCVTAAKIARLLQRLGWRGRPHPCRRSDCALRESFRR